MTNKVQRLTPEQRDRFGEFVTKWSTIGLLRKAADRKRAEHWMSVYYRQMRLAAPEFIWCSSPLDCADRIVAYYHNKRQGNALAPAFRTMYGYGVFGHVWNVITYWVHSDVLEQARQGVMMPVRRNVLDNAWNPLRNVILDSLSVETHTRLVQLMGLALTDSGLGQFNADSYAIYDYFRRVCGLERPTNLMVPQMRAVQSVAWWIPLDGVCFAIERHQILEMDDQGRLHSEYGPALAYGDGFEVYAWHGVMVPKWVVRTPQHITIELINEERNSEVRRVMLERYGLDRYILDAGGRIVDASEYGTLLRLDQENEEPLVMVRVRNSTPEADGSFKEYMLRVPPTVNSALEAVAWTFGVSPDEYEPLIET